MAAVTAAQAAKGAGLKTVLTPQEMFAAEALGSQAGTSAYRFANNIIRGLMDLPVVR